MRQRARLTFVFALLGAIALVASGCGGDDGSSGGGGGATTTGAAAAATTTTGAPAGAGEQEIKLTAKGIKWDTDNLELKAGTEYTVEVDNQDTVEHNFTFAEGNANKDVEEGEDITVTFMAPAAGSYEFHCKYHPTAMKGTVTVT